MAAKNHELLAVLPVPIGKGRANLRNPYYLQKQRCLESPLIGSRGRGGDCPRRAGSSPGRRSTGNRVPHPGLSAIGHDHSTCRIQPEFPLAIWEMHNAMSSAFLASLKTISKIVDSQMFLVIESAGCEVTSPLGGVWDCTGEGAAAAARAAANTS